MRPAVADQRAASTTSRGRTTGTRARTPASRARAARRSAGGRRSVVAAPGAARHRATCTGTSIPRWDVAVRGRRAHVPSDGRARRAGRCPHGARASCSPATDTGSAGTRRSTGGMEPSATLRVSHAGGAPFWMVTRFRSRTPRTRSRRRTLPVWAEAGALAHSLALRISRAARTDYVLLADPASTPRRRHAAGAAGVRDRRRDVVLPHASTAATRAAMVDGAGCARRRFACVTLPWPRRTCTSICAARRRASSGSSTWRAGVLVGSEAVPVAVERRSSRPGARRREKPLMCGIAGFVESPSSHAPYGADDASARARAPHVRRHPASRPRRRGSGRAPASALGMRRLSIIDLAERPPADSQRGRHRLDRLQRRDLQLPRAARASSRRAATASTRRPTPRSSSTPTRSGARLRRAAARDVRPRDLGHAARARCCWRATASASSRCTTPRSAGGCTSARSSSRSCARPGVPRDSTSTRSITTSSFLYTPRDRSIFSGVRKLPPGHVPDVARRPAPTSSVLGAAGRRDVHRHRRRTPSTRSATC